MSQRGKGSERPRATLTSQSRLAEEEDLKSGLADLSEKWPSSPGESCKIFWATPFTETGGKQGDPEKPSDLLKPPSSCVIEVGLLYSPVQVQKRCPGPWGHPTQHQPHQLHHAFTPGKSRHRLTLHYLLSGSLAVYHLIYYLTPLPPSLGLNHPFNCSDLLTGPLFQCRG